MKKPELIAALVAAHGTINKVQATDFVDALERVFHDAALAGNEILIPGLGKIKTVTRAARVSRNPRTGEQVAVPPKRVLKFAVSVTLKRAVVKQDGV